MAVEVLRVKKLEGKLKQLEQKARRHSRGVLVGFTAKYALAVHERVDIPHRVGQAKFLEEPAKTRIDEIKTTIRKVATKTGDFGRGLFAGGLLLQRFAQQLVPVNTGFLKSSAFTRWDNS